MHSHIYGLFLILYVLLRQSFSAADLKKINEECKEYCDDNRSEDSIGPYKFYCRAKFKGRTEDEGGYYPEGGEPWAECEDNCRKCASICAVGHFHCPAKEEEHDENVTAIPTFPTPKNETEEEPGFSFHALVVTGGVVGGIVLFLVTGGIAVCCSYKKQQQEQVGEYRAEAAQMHHRRKHSHENQDQPPPASK